MRTTKLLLAIASLGLSLSSFAQVKIGDNPTTINPGSVLELESTNKGLLLPRVNLTSTTVWSPLLGTATAGMHVYNKDTTTIAGSAAYPTLAAKKGEYYWDGTGWVAAAKAVGCAAFDAYRNSTQTVIVYDGIVTSTPITLLSDTEVYDPANAYNPATGEYTVPVTGFYSFSISSRDVLVYSGTAVRNSKIFLWSQNRGQLAASVFPTLNYGTGTANSISFSNYLTAGDKITLRLAVTHSGGTQPSTTIPVNDIKFSGSRLDCTNN